MGHLFGSSVAGLSSGRSGLAVRPSDELPHVGEDGSSICAFRH